MILQRAIFSQPASFNENEKCCISQDCTIKQWNLRDGFRAKNTLFFLYIYVYCTRDIHGWHDLFASKMVNTSFDYSASICE